MYQIKNFFELPYYKKSLLIKSLVLTIFVQTVLYIIPFSRIQTIISRITKIQIKQKKPKQIKDIIWAVLVVSSYIPRATCLVQAITVHILLAHNGYDSTIKIGVNNLKNFEAHAWVEKNNDIILGKSEMNFVPLLNLK